MSTSKRNPIGEKIDRIASLIRPWASHVPVLRRLLRRIRARLPAARTTPSSLLMDAFGAALPTAFFIQIGANDGVNSDPLRRQISARKWRGIMIEPVPHIFERLRRNCAGLRHITLENIAIGARDGHADFHSLIAVDDPIAQGLPDWYAGLGSFRRDVILSHSNRIPDIEKRIVTQQLPCLTFESLCARHGIDKIDLLQIDTEGYDYEVIKLVDLDRYRPALIVYEHVHLSAEDRAACEALLRQHGYEIGEFHLDTLALHVPTLATARPRLLGAWRTLFPTAR